MAARGGRIIIFIFLQCCGMNTFFFGDAELFSPPLIGQLIKDSFSDETIFQEHETNFFGIFYV